MQARRGRFLLTGEGRFQSVSLVAAPHPDQGVGESLLEDAAVAVARGPAEYVAVVVALRLESGSGAVVGPHPVVIGALRIF